MNNLGLLHSFMSLKQKYENEIVPAMMKKFDYKNKFVIPKIKKVILNVGFGKLMGQQKDKGQKKIQQAILEDLSLICGQRPMLTFTKKAIAGFKTKKGQIVGAKATLRRERMWNFLEKLINTALPRCRDFQGVTEKSIGQNGNLTLGIKEQIIFPEIMPEKIALIFGFEITLVVMSQNKEQGVELLKLLGFPIKKEHV